MSDATTPHDEAMWMHVPSDWPTSAEHHDGMKDYERSSLDGFDYMTLPLTADVEAPPGSLAKDPRSVTACRHAWDGTWGVPGERQHHCTTCQRWIWEHSIDAVSPREQTQ